MARFSSSSVALLCALAYTSLSSAAAAQSTIKRPGDRPAYSFEAEPHLLLEPFDWRGEGFGLGFRGTVEVAPRGFIPSINNSVGIGFGLDWVHYPAGAVRGICSNYVAGPNGTRICTEVDYGRYDRNYFYLPIVMQWNFWLHRSWSVFAEPGILPYFHGSHPAFGALPLSFYAGGRYHFSDRVTLTMRIGYPTLSVGVSFLL
jgi:hypothetical protein